MVIEERNKQLRGTLSRTTLEKHGKVLLARPNLFIVNHMKQLITACGLQPLQTSNLDQLQHLLKENILAAVISTSVSSSVKENQFEVLELIHKTWPGLPIFLATMTEVKSLRNSFKKQDSTKGYVIKSIEEAMLEPDHKSLIAIRKKDLLQSDLMEKARHVMKNHINQK